MNDPTLTPSRAITVLGMHRSGTSMLMGTLQEAGVYLGDVLDQGFEFNRKGLLEPRAILYMQEDLFKANGGSWKDPPETLQWAELHLGVRDLFIESRAAHRIWGFKDPRTLFTLSEWQAALPALELVGIFRHPAEVAGSIHKRNALGLEQGFDIWLKYNRRLLQAYEANPFPIIEFATERTREKLAAVVDSLNLPVSLAPSQFTFFDEDIPQQRVEQASLPPAVESVYQRLREIAL